jgi:SAM-dependent methyltransferase
VRRPTDVALLEIVGRWDTNAPYRWAELHADDDLSYRALVNMMTNALQRFGRRSGTRRLSVLDVGCGLGFLAREISRHGHRVTAVDPSTASIKLAETVASEVSFVPATLEKYAELSTRGRFDAVIANMTLHCVPDLDGFLAAARSMLTPRGLLVATIPNPDSYLQGREDVDLTEVDLSRPEALEIPFRIHGHRPHLAEVFFFHRPVSTHRAAAETVGLRLDGVKVPPQIGPGKPRDIAVLTFGVSPRP